MDNQGIEITRRECFPLRTKGRKSFSGFILADVMKLRKLIWEKQLS